MAKKDRVLTPLGVDEQVVYEIERSHLYALVAADMCGMAVRRNCDDQHFVASRFGDVMSVRGWETKAPEGMWIEFSVSDLQKMVECGQLVGFAKGERARIHDDIMLKLDASPLPF